MTTLVFNYEKLHDAVVLLLDPKHGPIREKLCRDRIREIDHRRPARFYRAQEPLNELMHVAEQNKNQALQLLDMAASRRDKTAEAVKAAAPTVSTARANWAKRMSEYRNRLRIAVHIEELLYNKTYNREQKQARGKAISAKWAEERKAFISKGGARPSVLQAEFSKMLDERLEKDLAFAEANKGIRAMSTSSQRRLDQQSNKSATWQKKFDKRFRGK